MVDCFYTWFGIIGGVILYLTQNTAANCSTHSGIKRLEADKYGTVNFFHSPGTTKPPDHTYYDNQYCEWQIKSEDTSRLINLQVNILNVEKSSSCQYDNITIYDGPDDNSAHLATICGENINPSYHSSSIYFFVIFTSNSNNHFRGFTAKYASVKKPNSGDGDATLGATIGSIAAGSLVIGGLCCCCLKKGMNNRAIKPSTTFRFGNRGGLFANSSNTPALRGCTNSTQSRSRSRNDQSVFNVRTSTVQFNTPLGPPGYLPPPYSSLGTVTESSPHSVHQGTRTHQSSMPPVVPTHTEYAPPAYRASTDPSADPLSPTLLDFSEPPRYSSIAGPPLTISETHLLPPPPRQNNNRNRNNGNAQTSNQSSNSATTVPSSDESTPWSPPPPYHYEF